MAESQIEKGAIEKIAASAKSRLDMWTNLIRSAQIRQMAEIGVWRGEFTEAMLRASPEIQKYYLVDPWRTLDRWKKPANVDDASFHEIYDEALRRTEFAVPRRIVMRGTTIEMIHNIPEGSLDLVYVDGDHTLRGITIDLVAWYGKVKPGYYLGGDDFSPTIWQHSLQFEPTLVFPFAVYFAEAVGATIYCLPFNQFLLRKPRIGERAFAVVDFTGKYGDADLLPQLSLSTLIMKTIRENLPDPLIQAIRGLRHGLKR